MDYEKLPKREREKSLEERYADDILTDNTALDKYRQCKTCAFRDKTEVQGKECGWIKGVCEVFQHPSFKPDDVMRNRDVCDYYLDPDDIKVNYKKELDKILETNKELRELFEKHPERRELYLQKMKESDLSGLVTGHIKADSQKARYCKSCAFRHGKPPFADLPEKAYCEIYNRDNTNGKPSDVYYDGAECEFYIKDRG